MKKIDTYNYEIFFLDYFEKNLSQGEIKSLFEFLDVHPDLKTEFYDFENTKLSDAFIQYPSKSLLKVNTYIELEIIAYIENDLSPNKRKEIANKIENNSIYKAEFQSYSKTQLPPVNIEYKSKESLKRKRSILPFYLYGAAASVVLLIGLFWFTNDKDVHIHSMEMKSFAQMETMITKEGNIKNRDAQINASFPLEMEKEVAIATKEKQYPTLHPPSSFSILESKSLTNLISHHTHEPLIMGRPTQVHKLIIDQKEEDQVQYLRVFANISRSIFKKSTKDILKKNSDLFTMDLSEIIIAGYNKLTDKEISINKVKDDSGKLLAVYLSNEEQRLFRYKKK